MTKHRARKRFGQNFLTSPIIIHQIIQAIQPKNNEQIIEIGAGQGALTEPLLQHLDHLYAIELDRDLVKYLQYKYPDKNQFTLYSVDVLKFDFKQIFNHQKLRIVGNLPYNISTPLIFRLIKQIDLIQDMHFMLQKEVVERISAKPNSKHYNALSVILQLYCQIQSLFDVPPSAFEPAPKVTSSIVRLTPYQQNLVNPQHLELFETLVKQAFRQKRKTLHNNLKQIDAEALIPIAGLDSKIRAENLTLADFAKLTELYQKVIVEKKGD